MLTSQSVSGSASDVQTSPAWTNHSYQSASAGEPTSQVDAGAQFGASTQFGGWASASEEEEPYESEASLWQLRGRKIPLGRLLMSLNQLSVMCQNGIDISEALATASRNTRHARLAETLEALHDSINSGASLSASLQLHAQSFPPTLPAMIAAAESTGEVPAALQRICEMMRAELQLRSTVVSAMIYPVILILVSAAVMLAMLFGVLPQFGEVFGNLGRPMPASTEVLLGLGKWCRANLVWCLLGGGVLMTLGFFLRSLPAVRRFGDWALLYFPMIRQAYRPLACGRMFRLAGSMLSGGIPLLETVQLTQRSLANVYLRELLLQVEEDVLAGDHASRALNEVDFLPPEAAQMVGTAERTGKLAEVLIDCGRFYEEQGERILKRVVHSLEPIIILVMGVLVAGVVLSIMLPLLDISSVAS